MGINTIDLVHHIMDIYGKVIEMELKDNQKKFDEQLDTNIPIEFFWKELTTESSINMMGSIHTQRFR